MKRSLIFIHQQKDSNTRLSGKFYKFKKLDPLDILNQITQIYESQQIEEIILEDHNIEFISDQLREKLEEFVHLESLSLNRCNLKSLKNLPNLRKLQRFTADSNQLRVRHLFALTQYPELMSLSVIENDIRQENLKEFVEFLQQTQIQQLNLFYNPIIKEQPQVVADLFFRVPQLQLIDNLDRQGTEIEYEGDEDHLDMELGRNDGEDVNNTNTLLKEGCSFEWSLNEKKEKPLPPIINSILENNGAHLKGTKTPYKKNQDFMKEKEQEDEDDEEFEPIDEEDDMGDFDEEDDEDNDD